MRTNRHPGRCCECTAWVEIGAGTLAERPDRWDTVCSGALCRQKVYGLEPVANPRVLRADGTIPLPRKGPDTPLLEAIAVWDQSVGAWCVTPEIRDRELVAHVCQRIGVEVHTSWLNYDTPAHVLDKLLHAGTTCGGRYYQLEGTRWLALHERGLLADKMGLGKTKQFLDSLSDDTGLIVVCPAVVKGVWRNEIQKWCPDRFDSIVVCEGWGSFHWPRSTREVVIINYDIVPPTPAELRSIATQITTAAFDNDSAEIEKLMGKLRRLAAQSSGTAGAKLFENVKEILKKAKTIRKPTTGGPPVTTVFDEVHNIKNNKNNKTLRTKRCRVISKWSARCYGLTGTPIENDPLELWGVLTSIGCRPPQWSGSKGWFKFLDAFGAKRKVHGGFEFEVDDDDAIVVKPGTPELLRRVMLRRTEDDVGGQLPPMTFSELPVPVTPELIKRLDAIEPRVRELLAKNESPDGIAEYMQLRKALAASRIDAMVKFIEQYEESKTPLLVLSAHRKPIEKLAKRKGWHHIMGGVSISKRDASVAAFQAGEGLGFAGTFRSMGVGITLTRAAHVLVVDQELTPSKNSQGYARAARIGQKASNVHVTIMYSDHPLDLEVSRMLTRKATLVARTLGES